MTTHNTPDSKQEAPHGETTRVKERLNLHYHGMKECEKPTMFREVREWLREMDDAGAESLHALICGVVHRHCAGIQLPHGTNGLENDLIEALVSRASAVEGDAQVIAQRVVEYLSGKYIAPDIALMEVVPIAEVIAAASSPAPAEPSDSEMCQCRHPKRAHLEDSVNALRCVECPCISFQPAQYPKTTVGPLPTTAGGEQVISHDYGDRIVYETRKVSVEIPDPPTSEAAKAHGLRRIARRHYHPEARNAVAPAEPLQPTGEQECQRCGKKGGKVVSFNCSSMTTARWVCPYCLDAAALRTQEGEGK